MFKECIKIISPASVVEMDIILKIFIVVEVKLTTNYSTIHIIITDLFFTSFITYILIIRLFYKYIVTQT